MAIGNEITVPVEKIALGGDGLGSHEGKKVFIPLSAPGDIVKARITEEHDSWAKAEISEIYEYSAGRIEPACPYYGVCGGCSLQHLSYEAQLEAKKAILTEELAKTRRKSTKDEVRRPEDGREPEMVPDVLVIPSNPWEYRNRVSLHAAYRAHSEGKTILNRRKTGISPGKKAGSPPHCGFKARKSEAVIPLDDCPAAESGIRNILPNLLPPPGKDRFTLYSLGGTMLAETGTSVSGGEKNRRQIPNRGTISLLKKEITLEASSFFQSNAGALEKLIAYLRKAAEDAVGNTGTAGIAGIAGNPDEQRIADLYAGAGTLSLFLADLFPGGIDLVETDCSAIEMAKINLAKTKSSCRYFPQKTELWVKKRNLGGYGFIVADPPRQGLSPLIIQSLCQSGPPVFVYVSCEASTFARDCRLLAQNYRPKDIFLFDFYPQTAHIETMGIFVRK